MTIPPPPPPEQTKKSRKNIVIALGVILIIIIALIAGVMVGLSVNQSANPSTPTPTAIPTSSTTPTSNPTPSPTMVPYDFTISTGNQSFIITQGSSFNSTIALNTLSGNVEMANQSNIIFSANTGSSGIEYSFNDTSTLFSGEQQLGFSSLLLITVPESTPTSNYTITVTARIGSISHSTSIMVSVESSTVTVSGTVYGGTLHQILFTDMEFSNQPEHYATLTGNTYSISLPNHRQYYVTGIDGIGTQHIMGGFWLEVPAGSTSLNRNFTYGG
jgi:hypothetical protein